MSAFKCSWRVGGLLLVCLLSLFSFALVAPFAVLGSSFSVVPFVLAGVLVEFACGTCISYLVGFMVVCVC